MEPPMEPPDGLFVQLVYIYMYIYYIYIYIYIYIYSGTSLIRSPMGLPKSDLNGEVTVLQGVKLHCGIQFGTENG